MRQNQRDGKREKKATERETDEDSANAGRRKESKGNVGDVKRH